MGDGFREAFEALEAEVSDIRQRLDTLQTPLWKRILFRLDGWPGQKDLNADRPRWRPWRRWFISCFVLFLIGGTAQAGPSNDPLTFVLQERMINQPVDFETWCLDCTFTDWTQQEPWVVNPTTCMWDTDDEFDYRSAGNVLAAGASATVTDCLLKGTQLVRVSTLLQSSSPDLIVTYVFTWNEGSESFTIVPAFSAHRWHYDGCIAPDLFAGTPTEVAGSHGGMAVPISITVTILNPTSRKVSQTGGRVTFGWQPFWVSC